MSVRTLIGLGYPGLTSQVASRSALIALKVLSANPQTRVKDIIDLQNLLDNSVPNEVTIARQLLYNRSRF